MKTTHTLLFALMIPAMAALAACDRNDADDASDVAPPAVDVTPADTAPDTTPPPMDATGDAMSFTDMDKNADGGITMDELTPDQMLHQHFTVADADGDGKLTDAEVKQHRADMGMPDSY